MNTESADRVCSLRLSRRLLAKLQTWQPTLEGLFQLTILDGRRGLAQVQYDPRQSDDFSLLLDVLISAYPGECELLEIPGVPNGGPSESRL